MHSYSSGQGNVAIGAAIGGLILVAIIGTLVYYCCKKKKSNNNGTPVQQLDSGGSVVQGPQSPEITRPS